MSELGKRIVSGVLLAAILIGDLWLGSWWYLGLLTLGGLVVFHEFGRLVLKAVRGPTGRIIWLLGGALYIALAIDGLWHVRSVEGGFVIAACLFVVVWAVDVGAYAFGRTLRGPKIAPAISPSKTWAGLFGGVVCASLVVLLFSRAFAFGEFENVALFSLVTGTLFAVLAQIGDFFESWMKRRADVKDSGALIPGHGGLFDRVDGLLPVAIVFPYMMGVAR